MRDSYLVGLDCLRLNVRVAEWVDAEYDPLFVSIIFNTIFTLLSININLVEIFFFGRHKAI